MSGGGETDEEFGKILQAKPERYLYIYKEKVLRKSHINMLLYTHSSSKNIISFGAFLFHWL